MAQQHSLCPSCDAPVEPEGVCLACLFEGALGGETEDSFFGEDAESGFGEFARPTAGRFGKYVLQRKLGEGGMGVIWEAQDTTLQRVVALKMIRGFAFSTDREKQRFQAEANAVAQLDHPHIVPIYEVGEIEDQPYFSMKLLSGGTLSGRMQDGAMEARNAAAIMEKLARAIGHAHERGVLHRDLKPDNVLFDEKGEPFLTDFGLAKMLDTSSGLTLTHAHIGTPQYMSPEQARGRAGDITAASDVWGAGALFFQMLTGSIPFPGSSTAEILDRVSVESPVPMEPEGQIDKQLETLCLRCLQKDPAQRLPSAEFLADELARWSAGESIASKSQHGQPTKRRSWQLILVGCLLVTAVFVAIRHGNPFSGDDRSDETPQVEKPVINTGALSPEEVATLGSAGSPIPVLDAAVQKIAPETEVALVFLEGEQRLHQSGDHGVEVHVRVRAEGTAIMDHVDQVAFEALQKNGLLEPKSTRGWFGDLQNIESDFRAIHFEPNMTSDTTIWRLRSKPKSCWEGDIVIHTGNEKDHPFFRATENLILHGSRGKIVRVRTNDHEAQLGVAQAAIYLSDRGWMELHWTGDKAKLNDFHTTYFLSAGATLQGLGLRPGTLASWDDEVFGKMTLIVQPE